MPSWSFNSLRLGVGGVCLLGVLTRWQPSVAVEAGSSPAASQRAAPSQFELPKQSGKDRYCSNILDRAVEARDARRKKLLGEIETGLSDKLEAVERRTAELKSWIERYEQALNAAQAHVVEIYAQMRPDAAAQQLTLLNDAEATAILMKLKPKASSAILNEMDTSRAAALARMMASNASLTGARCS